MRRSYRSPSKAQIAALLVLSSALACGYSFRSPVPAHLDTLYVLTFENETREFQLTQQLTERVVNEFLNESRLRLVGDEEDADLVVLGTIKDYEFYVSEDGKEFGEVVKKGTFADGKQKQTITFDPRKGRFVKLKALSEINEQPWTSAAEIGVVTE